MNQFNLRSLEPKILRLDEMNLVAHEQAMSFADDKTAKQWQIFSPLIKSIPKRISSDKYVVQVYPSTDFFIQFDPHMIYKKYAAVRVSDDVEFPEGLMRLTIPAGQYAVFDYVGKPSEAREAFQYMHRDWLPQSGYQLDDRPHLAHMGEKYRGERDDTEEAFYVPIR